MAEDTKDEGGSTRGLLLSGLVILGLLGAGLWWSQGTPEVQTEPTPGEGASPSPVGGPAGEVRGDCSLPDGVELRYRWGTKLGTEATNPLTDSGAPMLGRASLSGDLTLKVLEAREGGWTLQGRVAVDDDAMKGLFAAGVLRDLMAPFALEMASDCAMERIGFPASWGPETRAALHALLTPFDVGYPRGPAGTSWNRTHADGRGRLLIAYQAQDETRSRFHRRRLQYTKLWPGAQGEVTVQAQASTVSMASDGAWIESLEERVRYGVQRKGRPLVVEKMDYTLTRQRGAVGEPMGVLSLDGLQWMHLRDAPPRRDPASVATDLPKSAESASLQEMVEAVLAVLGDSDKKREAHALLVAYLKRFPERAAELERFIRTYPGASADLATLFRALKSAGTPEAQEALVRLMEDPSVNVMDRVRGAAALGGISNPTDETVAALQRVSNTLSVAETQDDRLTAGSATAALGRILGEVEQSQPELAAELEASLQERMSATLKPEEASALLRAVGNSGSEGLLPSALEQLKSPLAVIRKEAARSLRRMDPESTSDLYGELFHGEPSETVRLELVKAMIEQCQLAGTEPDGEVISQAIEQLELETNAGVRLALVKLLGRVAESHPEARAALIAQFKAEKATAVLKLIGRYIPASELP